MTTSTLEDIQKRAATLSKTRDVLSGLMHTLQVNIETVKSGSMADIKRVARQIAKQHTELQDLIKANPALFVRPRTHVVDGLKFGLQKQPGKLSWDTDAKLCERIHKLEKSGDIAPEAVELLITVTEKLVAKALEKLDAKTLKRLGIEVAADADEPLIKSVDSEVEKAVNAVIKDVTKDANSQVHGAEVTA